MTAHRFVALAGVSDRTLRRWFAAGFLPPPLVAGERGCFVFTEYHLEVLRAFQSLRAQGRSLDALRPRVAGQPCDWWPERSLVHPELDVARAALQRAGTELDLPFEILPLLALSLFSGAVPPSAVSVCSIPSADVRRVLCAIARGRGEWTAALRALVRALAEAERTS